MVERFILSHNNIIKSSRLMSLSVGRGIEDFADDYRNSDDDEVKGLDCEYNR